MSGLIGAVAEFGLMSLAAVVVCSVVGASV